MQGCWHKLLDIQPVLLRYVQFHKIREHRVFLSSIVNLTQKKPNVLYIVYMCVCYAMGHAAWNKSYDDDDDINKDKDKAQPACLINKSQTVLKWIG